ncbi:hypothetical protein CMV03_17190 [Elizabethkingia anophelis]|nr:hypothetical protein [Elizabethkingia anophelis]
MKSKAISTVTKSLPDFFDNLYKSLVFNRYSFFLKTLKYKYPKNAIEYVSINFESQETVDRDYEGNWYYYYK